MSSSIERQNALLKRCYLFDGASDRAIDGLAREGMMETLPAKRGLFEVGDEADGLRIVESGLVRIWINDSDGKELTLTLLEPGDAVGEVALLDGMPRSANATALEKTTLLLLSRASFDRILESEPSLARHLIELLCERLRRVTDDLEALAFLDLRHRLGAKLRNLAFAHARIENNHAHFVRRFSQTDLAMLLGVSREAVNKHLAALSNDGIISVENGIIEIHDLDRLARAKD